MVIAGITRSYHSGRRLLLLQYKVAIPKQGTQLWEATPIFSHFFCGRLLPFMATSFVGGYCHIFWGVLLPSWAVSSVGGLGHFFCGKPCGHIFHGRMLPHMLFNPTGIMSQGEQLSRNHSHTSAMGGFCLNRLFDPGIMRSADRFFVGCYFPQ